MKTHVQNANVKKLTAVQSRIVCLFYFLNFAIIFEWILIYCIFRKQNISIFYTAVISKDMEKESIKESLSKSNNQKFEKKSRTINGKLSMY